MIWVTQNTYEYKHEQKKCWHRWFAWYPVTIREYEDGAKKRVWLEWILRKGYWFRGWNYEYRLLDEI